MRKHILGMLVGALALSYIPTVARPDAEDPTPNGTTEWRARVHVYNHDQTIKIKSFTAGKNDTMITFASKEACEEFMAKDPGFAEAQGELRAFVKAKVDPTFVLVAICEAVAAGTEKI